MAAEKVGVVTGGASGIGKAITGVLLKNGYKVGLLDQNEAGGTETLREFQETFGAASCVFLKCDVTDSDQFRSCYEEVAKRLGPVSVMVNNAGICNEEKWSKMVDINLRAVMDGTYIAVEHMRKDRGGAGGRIVNVASAAGLLTFPGFPGYAATKWGVVGFTKSMADSMEKAAVDWGLTFMALCPFYVATPMIASVPPKCPHIPEVRMEEAVKVKSVTKEIVITPEELADAFEKLFTENRNGAVMRLAKKDGVVRAEFVSHKWEASTL